MSLFPWRRLGDSCNRNSSPKFLNTPFNVSMVNGDLTKRVNLKTEKWISWTKHIGSKNPKCFRLCRSWWGPCIQSGFETEIWKRRWSKDIFYSHQTSAQFIQHSMEIWRLSAMKLKGSLKCTFPIPISHKLATCVPIDNSTPQKH